MKRILCFGDSNTWGFIPKTEKRYDYSVRWTGILQNELLPDCQIIEEGQSGRTTIWDDNIGGYKNGRDYLYPCLETHTPIDIVVLMLGSNDFKRRFALNANDIAASAGVLVNIIKTHPLAAQDTPPKILLVRPASLLPLPESLRFSGEFCEEGYNTSLQTKEPFLAIAQKYGCAFLDADTCTEVSPLDCLHFTANGHRLFAQGIADVLKTML